MMLAYLSACAGAHNLLPLQALLDVAPGEVEVYSPSPLAALTEEYRAHPFFAHEWRAPRLVHTDRGSVLRAAGEGRYGAVLVQTDSAADWEPNACLLEALGRHASLVVLDTSDDPRPCRALARISSLYLHASLPRGRKAPPRVRDAPYLVWGIAGPGGAGGASVRDIDVCFIGSLRTHPSRMACYEALERESIRNPRGRRFSLMATGHGPGEAVSPGRFRSILLRSRVSVDLRGNGVHTKRLFESLACGCLAISQHAQGGPRSSWSPIPGRHFVPFGSPDGMIRLIRRYLDHPDEAEAIARSGGEWLRSTYTLAATGGWLRERLGEAAGVHERGGAGCP